jgi:hypothetical protein
MSDQPLPQDELASALLDSEVTGPRPLEAPVAARVDELRRASEAIAQPLQADDAGREQAIAAALDAFDALPTPMKTRSRFVPALAAVAAAVLVLVGVVAVLSRDDSTSTDTATGGQAASGAATVALGGGGASTSIAADRAQSNAAAGQGEAAPAVPAPGGRDLGSISDPTALRAALGSEAFTSKAAQLVPTPIACEDEARAGAGVDLGTLTDDVTLQWKGQAARALVFVDAASASHIVVVADPSCAVLDLID